jgi:phage-related minor tail protein
VVAIIALIGSFSVVGGILLGIVAVILGFIARGRAKSGEATNGGVALAGIILGVVSIVAGLAFIAIWVSLFKEVGATDYFDCLEQAGQDRSAVQQCSDEFRQSVSERLSSAPTPAR